MTEKSGKQEHRIPLFMPHPEHHRAHREATLLHGSLSTETLEGLDDLLGLLLGNGLLHDLGDTLDELLAVDQRQTEHGLDLLDDLGLSGGIEGLELEVEQGLLLGSRGSFLLLRGGSSGSSRSSSTGHGEAANGQVGDVQTGLQVNSTSVISSIIQCHWFRSSSYCIMCIRHVFLGAGDISLHATAGGRRADSNNNNSSTHLQAGDEVSGLQQGQLANLVNDLRNLRVRRGGSGSTSIGRLPSPSGRPPALGEICGRRDAQGRRRADDLSAASSCGLGGERHDGGDLAVKGRTDRETKMGTEALFPDIQISLRKETRTSRGRKIHGASRDVREPQQA